MKNSTIIGLILGLFALIVGMILKGAPITALISNPAAYVIILGGTCASVFMAFPMRDLSRVPKLFKIVFAEPKLLPKDEVISMFMEWAGITPKLLPKDEVISMFMEWAGITRREGLLALETRVEEIEDQFLKNGMRMIIDGNDQEFVRDVLLEDISATEERHKSGAAIFSQAGMYAPTLGVLGAVIGLIAALGNLEEMEKLAHAVAAAFVATLLGIFTGYVLWHPIANKLKRLSKREIELRLMMVEGLLSIQSGVSTTAIQQKLSVFLTPTERLKLAEKEEREREQKATA